MMEPIAVVGSSCRFPGGASSPSKLWRLLKNPRDVLSTIPKDRLGLGAFYHEDGEHHGSTNVVAKGYLLEEDPRLFDAPFFNINPMEADAMDPQQRLLLESVYECIESAGYPLDRLQGSATSVYVGCMTNDYRDIQGRDLETINRYHGTGSTFSILSNRISYFFDFRGPSVTLDTACSSSLAALHFAVQSLRNGESTSSIVGGVNLIFDCTPYISESKLHMLSPTSRSSMWDASADGYARGEGVSALMLKTLSQALADGDHIECIIRETGMGQDGRTTGMTMPSGEAQASLIRETYARAGLDLRRKSDRPQYFEAHGTGTMAGDPQEARGIYDAFFKHDTNDESDGEIDEKLFCGSIKTVIGHLEGCAGLAGLLKASLAVQHGTIPPNLLFRSLNPDIAPYYHRLEVPTKAMPWPSGSSPRRASLNSFGFGGTNCHAIIEQYIPSDAPTAGTLEAAPKQQDFFAGPLLLSASTGASLAASINGLADMLEAQCEAEGSNSVSTEDLSFFTQSRRTTFPQRIAFSGGRSKKSLIDALRSSTTGVAPDNVGVRAPTKLKWRNPGILGIFTGQGAQWATMGRDLADKCFVFRKSLQACEAALSSLRDAPKWSLMEELAKEQSESRLSEAELAQPLCTAIQIALVDTLAAAGISFRGVVGHSSGEIAATYAAGLLSAEDAMRVAFYRGLHAHLARGERGQSGAMLAVGLGIDDAEAFCLDFGGRLSVAASNSPTSTTLSGDEDAVFSAKELLDERKTFARLLKVDTAYHSAHMLPCAAPYLASLRACNIQVRPPNNECIWISSVHGHAELLDDPADLTVLADEYWVANMCQPVLFSDAVECSLWRAGPFDLAVEVGAHPALKGPATQTITTALGPNALLPYVATLQRGQNDVSAFSASLGSLWTTLGNWVDLDGWRRGYLGPDCTASATVIKPMPSYSWSHDQVYWKESRLSSRYRLAERRPHELLGRRVAGDSDNDMRWRNVLKVSELPWTRGHVFQKAILFPTVGYVALAVEAAAEIAGLDRIKLIEVHDLIIPRALVLEDNHAGVEIVFSVRRRQPASNDALTIDTDFACHSSVQGGTLEKNVSGRLIIELFSSPDMKDDDSDISVLPERRPSRSGTTSIEGEAYYQALLKTTGLDYTGLFRGMKQIRRTLGFSSARASWPAEDVGNQYIAHPGLLDVALQGLLAAMVNPTRIPIQGSFLPSAMSRMVINPHARSLSDDGTEVVFETDCILTKNTARSCEGDIHVFGPSAQCILQAEGFRMDNWKQLSAKEDRPVFSYLDYQPDLFHANGSNLPELYPDEDEQKLIEAINRSCLYYLRTYFSSVSDAQVASWTWDRRAFHNSVKLVLQHTSNGKHPNLQKSWLDDTVDLMESYKQTPEFKDQIDMRAVHVAGEHLAKVMAGEERPLEVYLRENVWAKLYSHGRYQVRLNRTIADLVRTFSHRYPRAKYCEVGGGSGGTTQSVLAALGDAVGQYTFTDVSAGFFEKTRERLAHTDAEAAGRVVYKVFDVERDPVEQGFEAESQDVVIAANVLHATTDLTKAVQNVRRLLKPGGYLFMLEVTGEFLEGLLLMGPLEGWWLGNREGTASQPGLSLQGWDDLFRSTGFTGVDKHQSDVPDLDTHAISVVVTQATDSRIEILREPLEFLDDVPLSDQVLIIGGQSLAMAKTVRSISQYVARFAGRVQVVQSIDKIDPDIHTAGSTAVIALCDLERPFFADAVTETRLQKLQALFAQATDMLWVTSGHLDDHDPHAAMMVGLCRTVVIELEHLNLQFLNMATKSSRSVDARPIVEAFVRLKLGASDNFQLQPVLWSTEPELTLTPEGEMLITRLKLDLERNDRLNSAGRHIIKTVDSSDVTKHKYTAVSRDGSISFEEAEPWLYDVSGRQQELAGNTAIRTAFSVTLPWSSSTVLATGLDQENRPMLVLTNAHSSIVSSAPASSLALDAKTACNAEQLRACALSIFAKQVLATIPRGASQEPKVVIHGASPDLAQVIAKLAGDHSQLVFTQSTASVKTSNAHIVPLHPRASTYNLQRSLPANVGYVVGLVKDDPVTAKLLSILPGITFDCDALLLEGKLLPLAELGPVVSQTIADKVEAAQQTLSISAHRLPGLPNTSLKYPAVVDWTIPYENSLQVTINPIRGQGLFSPDKTYFLVGLVSTLGRSICRWMVENGARHIALASRSAKIDSQWLEEVSQLGAKVMVYRMDVSDKTSVQKTVATIRAEMPPIAGVANAALVLRDRLFLDMQASDMNEVLGPKVNGSLYLHEEFSDPTLEFFILFSTLSCIIGNAGQSNYDAASLYQVMLTKYRRQQGLASSVIDVGAVADVGYVAERGQAMFDKLARTMKLPLSEIDVHQIFAEAVAASPVREGETVTSTTADIITGMGPYVYDSNTPSEAHPQWYKNILASHYVREEKVSNNLAGGGDADPLSVTARLEETTSEHTAAAVLTQALAARVETMLQMSPGSFKTDIPLLDVGIDSLLAVELRTWFLKEVHVDVPVLKLLSGESGESICAFAASQYLAENSKARAEADPTDSATPDTDSEHGGTASMSSSVDDQYLSPSGTSETGDSAVEMRMSDGEAEHKEEEVDDTSSTPTLKSTAPMTHAQTRMWIADQMAADHTRNNNILIYDVKGYVHVARLRRAVATVVAHHPGLHTCFFQDGTDSPWQGLLETPMECFRHIPASSESREAVQTTQNELRARKWCLQHGQALEVVLISHTSDEHTLLLGYHHIAMDGSAWRTFFRDLHMAYQGAALSAPGKSPISLAIEEATHDTVSDGLSTFWSQQFSTPPEPFPLLPFASVKARPGLERTSNHTVLVELEGSIADRINAISRSLGVTSVNFYLAAVQGLLSRLAETDDICIGVTDSGRDAETAESLGFFVNMLPVRLRTSTSGRFGELVKQVNTTYREARAHANVPFDAILDKVGVRRDPTCTPLFQVGFDVRPGQSATIPLGNCQLNILDSIDSTMSYDITFLVVPMPVSGPSFVQVITRTDLYSREATELLAQMYLTFLSNAMRQSVVDFPLGKLQMYPGAMVTRALEIGKPGRKAFDDWPSTITARFDQVLKGHSAVTAIKDADGSLSYAELAKDIMSLAARILPYRGRRIAVICEPQRAWAISMLAIWRVGATFVPLDATLPPTRLVTMLRASEADTVLCHAATSELTSQVVSESESTVQVLLLEDTPACGIGHVVDNLEDPSTASTILCTSGTTGVPKAILLTSRGLLNYAANQHDLLGVKPGETILQQSNLGFDLAIAQLLFAFCHGGTLVIAPQASRGDPVALTNLMLKENVSLTFATPTEYLMWLCYSGDVPSRLNRWRLAISGGEKVPWTLRKEFENLPHRPIFADCYGPAETSVSSTMPHDTESFAEDPLAIGATSIGRPLANTGIFIIDSKGHVCPPGIPGEIGITGDGLALGYVDPIATAKSFVDSSRYAIDSGEGVMLQEGTMYKTGDRGVWRSDGTLGFLGRLSSDTVVKIRGIRVDLSDVEHAILSQGSHLISDAVVTLQQDNDDVLLVAHVSPVVNNSHDLEAPLEDFMRQLPLPRHMKPTRVVLHTRLPTNANGKADRGALARTPLPPRKASAEHYDDATAGMATLTQVELHMLWARVLGRSDIPRRADVDFLAMGGSSLHLVKLQAAIRTDLLVNLSIRDMFMHSTLGSMAELIENRISDLPAPERIDWDQETRLSEDLALALSSQQFTSQPPERDAAEVLLTGADSFLGGKILRALLQDPAIRRVHCIAVASVPADVDPKRVVVYESSNSLRQQNLGLSEDVVASLMDSVDRIIMAGSYGHCLNNYFSLRQTNVVSTKLLAKWAARRRVPLHYISSSRVTLLHKDSHAALPPISVKDHNPPVDASEGYTASKWASEVFLENLATAAGDAFPITIHRPCALIGAEAPSEDALNAILKFSADMAAIPRVSQINIQGFFDFAPIENVAADIVADVLARPQLQCLRFRHYSGGVRVPPNEFKAYMERFYNKEFVELELEEWLARALDLGIEPLIT
ncbi:hypothetical protein AC578_9486, partial [Pseudocercospora eumusae]